VLVLGLRKGEVLGLAWEAVNFEHGTLVPDRQLQRVRRSLLYRETKTEASDAWLPMPEIVAAALTIGRAQQEGTGGCRETWQQTKDMPSLIFTGRYGTPLVLALSTGSSWGAVRPRNCVRSLFLMPGTRVPRCSST
jgi:integrase